MYSYTSYLNTALNSGNIHSKTRWVAQYRSSMGYTAFPTNDRGWQYTSRGSVSGISGTVDLNAFGNQTATSSAPSVPVYRVYNPNSGLHHYTMNYNEVIMLVGKGWRYEKTAFRAGQSGIPVYRVYNPNDGNHLFTMNSYERDNLARLGWHDEGVSWYVPSGGSINVYRLYNPNNGEHVFTTEYGEYVLVGRAGWHQEGVAWTSL